MDLVALIPIIGLFVTGVVYVYKHARMMKGYENKLKDLGEDLKSLGSVQKSFIDAFQKSFLALVTSLTKSGVIKKEDYSKLLKVYADSLGEAYKIAIPSSKNTNPLSEDEKTRLREYAEKAKRGERFERSEAEDFYDLSKKLSEEQGSNPGVWILLLLAAFVLGLILGLRD